MCLNTGTPKAINFPFGIYVISMVLSVPILKQFRAVLLKGLHCLFSLKKKQKSKKNTSEFSLKNPPYLELRLYEKGLLKSQNSD